jgi:hypothetical protein
VSASRIVVVEWLTEIEWVTTLKIKIVPPLFPIVVLDRFRVTRVDDDRVVLETNATEVPTKPKIDFSSRVVHIQFDALDYN